MIRSHYHAPDVSEGSVPMRGDDRQTGWMFSDLSPEERVPSHAVAGVGVEPRRPNGCRSNRTGRQLRRAFDVDRGSGYLATVTSRGPQGAAGARALTAQTV